MSLTRAEVAHTLGRVLEAWQPAFPYRLVGTAAALLQGVGLPARAIDVLCGERAAVDQFAAALAPYPALQEPVWLAGEHQYFCNYDVEGVEVGASTVEIDTDHDTTETFGSGPWRHYIEVALGDHRVPAVRLELRLATELLRRRRDRAAHRLPGRPRLRHAPCLPRTGERRRRPAHPHPRARQAQPGPVTARDPVSALAARRDIAGHELHGD